MWRKERTSSARLISTARSSRSGAYSSRGAKQRVVDARREVEEVAARLVRVLELAALAEIGSVELAEFGRRGGGGEGGIGWVDAEDDGDGIELS